ncbi:MAG: tRNA (N(6)-L-threonylcarbamoyladenosine(37)-C(2))-methylthiotransferase MtaB [Chloroflexi bacterium]|nr:tRNA (N(6)-L-threonylcarbamoyladenosine(37)-C(2))-methylthiotransferase MtaB [Chloroflexota bacterium]
MTSTPRHPAVYLETHGCKLNQADTQAMAARFLAEGYTLAAGPEEADVCVVNTCTVTHVADAKARHAVRSARRMNLSALLVATGCYAQRAPGQLAQLEGVDLVLANTQKAELVAQVSQALGLGASPCSGGEPAAAVEKAALPTRAMVKIQEGCNQVCAYCIVPRVRGREHSVHPDALVNQVQRLTAEGYREVVLTGTQLGTYGFDIPGASLCRLIARILAETSIPRLRVSSLQAHEITRELLELWSDPRLCPHLHLPLQSGSAQMLVLMRRRYSPEQYEHAVDMVRAAAPAAAVTADVIVGFPGETEELFEETYQLCQRVGFAALHLFPYSVRPGTSAAHFAGQVEEKAKRERMARLLALAKSQAARFQEGMVGSVRPVLWEASHSLGDAQVWSGLTDNYLRVFTRSGAPLHNQVTPVRLERRQGEVVWGTVCRTPTPAGSEERPLPLRRAPHAPPE